MPFPLNDEEMIPLDAENLAEQGINEAYESLLPRLRRYVPHPAPIEEIFDSRMPRYAVKFQDETYVIYAPGLEDDKGQSWDRATLAFFSIVNKQLPGSSRRFYAIHGGHELGGMFLTAEECEAAKRSLPRKEDWPYLPTSSLPWLGQYH